MADDDTTSLTTAKTLWSETILEMLYHSLKLGQSDEAIREVLGEVRKKGFKADYIIEKVEQKVDKQASIRVRGLLRKK